MPVFVHRTFNGKDQFSVEYDYRTMKADRSKRPPPIAVIEITDTVASLSIETLVHMYRDGIRPKHLTSPAIEQAA